MKIEYGKYSIERGLLLAPMEAVSDYPFRMICKELGGVDVLYSEFISSEAIIRDADRAFKKMIIRPQEHPIGIQIYGANVKSMVEAAQRAEEKGPDFIDINFGCPVKKVALKGAGAGLLKDIPQMIAISKAVAAATELPVTAKTRLGWDANSIEILDVARQLEDVGIEALALHARTRTQGYKGEADWEWIARVKEVLSIPVIGNGDVVQPEDARRMFEQTNCDAVMIGRGAINNPWLFRESRAILDGKPLPAPPNLDERIEVLKRHYELNMEYKGERVGVIEMRKHLSGYLKGLPHIAKFRLELMQFEKPEPIFEKLEALKNATRYRDLMPYRDHRAESAHISCE